jgi:uncharacterized protein YndB with AHSA1/START domain
MTKSAKEQLSTSDTSNREIVISRVLEAPRERVWEAMTDPKQLDAWWGPTGFRNITQEIAIKPGGIWRHTMIGPDGAEYLNVTKFEEVVKPERLVYVNGGGRKGGPGTSFRATWMLNALGEKTELTMRLVFKTPEDRDLVVREFGAVEGGKQTLGRLAEHVATNPAFELVLERIIDAPRTRVFEAWTKPEQMAQWFAPRLFKLVVHKMDFRPGGRFSMAMRGPNGEDFPFTGTYREIVPPAKLSWTGEFATGPADQMSTVVTFDEQGRTTRICVRQTFHVMTPEIEHATKGARQGWTMTFDQLEAFCVPQAGSNDRIEKRLELRAPVSRVWRALTDHREFGEWFRVDLDGPFVPGQVSRGRITYPGYEHLRWEAVVKDMEPERLFSFTWHPYAVDPKMDYSNEAPTLVEFRLEKTEHGTLLTLTESGFDKIPAARRAEALRMNEGGWTEQMQNLEKYVVERRPS